MKPRTLLLLPLITFFSVNSNAVMAALDHTAVTLIQDQSNYPELTESVAPTPGNPWTWSVSGFSGFAGSPSIWFDYQNADQTRAELHWSGFATSDWEGGADGSFTLTLSNGVDADRVYPMSLSLRSLVGDGYTVFEQQTSGGVMVLQPGAEGFVFSASNFSGLSPAPSISFDAMGAVLSCTTPNWTGDGTFTLTVKDGTRPDAVIDGVGLSLRYIDATNFTVFRGQTGGGDAIPATDAGTYGFGVAPGSFSGISSDLDLGFTSRGATYVNDPGTVTWDEDGTFTMRINDGTRPYSDLANLSLHLRRLVGTDFTVFQGQTGGGDAIPATDAGTYVFGVAPGSFSGISSDLDLGFTSRGAIYVNDPGTVTWDEDGTFTMRVNPDLGPFSDISGLALSLRRIIPSPLIVLDNGDSGSVEIQVDGDPGPWDWSDYADGLAMSALSAPDTSNSASVRISWGAGDLVGGETGSGSLTIRRSDQSAPASTTSLATQVTAAGCCIGMTGNIDGDPEEIIDIGDLTALISYLFIPPNEAPGCTEEANVDGDEEGIVDIGDLTALIDYLFISHTPPADCP